VATLAGAREIIERSFPVERFEPGDAGRWDRHYRRFPGRPGAALCLM
jgi:hypothetical protein